MDLAEYKRALSPPRYAITSKEAATPVPAPAVLISLSLHEQPVASVYGGILTCENFPSFRTISPGSTNDGEAEQEHAEEVKAGLPPPPEAACILKPAGPTLFQLRYKVYRFCLTRFEWMPTASAMRWPSGWSRSELTNEHAQHANSRLTQPCFLCGN